VGVKPTIADIVIVVPMETSFDLIISAAAIMRDFDRPWFVAGGWAIDLFLNRITREHSDIEIGIYRQDQQRLQKYLPHWSLDKAVTTPGSSEWISWQPNEELRLPIHQIRAKRKVGRLEEIEFFLNECRNESWLSRRHADLGRPREEVSLISAVGIPILAPEIQLLFKAKNTRTKDKSDFEETIVKMNRPQRAWLLDALRRYYPEHEWVAMIGRIDFVVPRPSSSPN
jgi:hypothetical protein